MNEVLIYVTSFQEIFTELNLFNFSLNDWKLFCNIIS